MPGHVKRNLDHPQRAKILAHVCAVHGVTPERFLAVVKARKEFRRAAMYRQRSKKRRLEKNGKRARFPQYSPRTHAGTGDFHDLLKILGWSMKDFAACAGIHIATAYGWFGHPLALWPVELLRLRVHNERMAAFIRSIGQDPDSYSPKPLPKFPMGRYPRKRGDVVVEGKTLAEYSPWKK